MTGAAVRAPSRIELSLPRSAFTLELELAWDARVLVLFGPSGSGKSSVLEVVLGLHRRARSRVELAGRVLEDANRGVFVPIEARRLGWVSQDPLLFPHLDVRGNVGFGAGRSRGSSGRDLERAVEVLEIGDLMDRRVDELSGGERQRVALARAIASGPDALLLDEPLAALDIPLRARVLPYLLRVRDELALPMLYITHDPDEAILLGEEVAVLDRGRLVASGTPREVLWSRDVRPLSEALGLENVLDGRVVEASHGHTGCRVECAGGLDLTVPWPLSVGDAVRIGVRAEDILISLDPPGRMSARNVATGRIASCESRDTDVVIHVDAGDRIAARVTAEAHASLGLEEGLQVHLVIKAHALRRLG